MGGDEDGDGGWLLGVCYLRESPARDIGLDRRAGKRETEELYRCVSGRCFGKKKSLVRTGKRPTREIGEKKGKMAHGHEDLMS